jgi:uncharacterized protein YndB with AHSA1/START domain
MATKLPAHPVKATLHADNFNWKLHMNRDFPQDQATVWHAITKADQVARWMPFRPAHDLLATGDVWLTPTDGGEEDAQGHVLEVDSPSSLHYLWGPDHLRFEVTPTESGTLLFFTHTFTDRNAAPSMAAGWHLCFAALEMFLAGQDAPSVVGEKAMDYGWKELEQQYKDFFNEKGDVSEPTGSV